MPFYSYVTYCDWLTIGCTNNTNLVCNEIFIINKNPETDDPNANLQFSIVFHNVFVNRFRKIGHSLLFTFQHTNIEFSSLTITKYYIFFILDSWNKLQKIKCLCIMNEYNFKPVFYFFFETTPPNCVKNLCS